MRLIIRTHKTACRFFAALTAMLLPSLAFAQDDLNGANTAWILTSTALVLFMTLPGLSLFYGGLVRTKNVLSVLMQCFSIAVVISTLGSWSATASLSAHQSLPTGAASAVRCLPASI